MSTQDTGLKPTRRTLVKGAAWSVPVVAVAGTAPAFAASPPEIIDWEASTACKIPGSSWDTLCYSKGYVLWAEFENPLSEALTINITGITVGGIPRCIVGLADTDVSCNTPLSSNTVQLDAGETRHIAIYTNSSDDSSSTQVTVYFNYQQASQPAPLEGDTSGNVGGSSWTTGGGSCRHGCTDTPPMNACDTDCAS